MSLTTLKEVLEQAAALPPDERQLLREVLSEEERSALFRNLLLAGVLLYFLEKTYFLMPEPLRFLKETHSSIPESVLETFERAVADSDLTSRATAVRAMRGKYAHLPTGSEEFAALKRQEIELEDRR